MSSTKIIRSFEEEIHELRQRSARLEGPATRQRLAQAVNKIREFVSEGERFTFSYHIVHTGEWVFLSEYGGTLSFHPTDANSKCYYCDDYGEDDYFFYEIIKEGNTYKLLIEYEDEWVYRCANITLHNVPTCLKKRFNH